MNSARRRMTGLLAAAAQAITARTVTRLPTVTTRTAARRPAAANRLTVTGLPAAASLPAVTTRTAARRPAAANRLTVTGLPAAASLPAVTTRTAARRLAAVNRLTVTGLPAAASLRAVTSLARTTLAATSLALAGLLLPAWADGAPNILIILADDLGTETLSSYGFGEPTAVTPTLDRMAAKGVRFERFWAQPACSPSRAAALSGRYAHRTGVTTPLRHYWALLDAPTPEPPAAATAELYYTPLARVESGEIEVMKTPPPPLPDGRSRGLARHERLLPQVLKSLPEPYATAAIGKWHLTDIVNGGVEHPNVAGFDYYSGSLFGLPASFFAWRHLENGVLTAESGYHDRRVNEDAIRWIREQGEAPWFLWLSYVNPHVPVHLPPRDLLHSAARDLEPDIPDEENNRAYFLAQVEAMDTLIGQLLDSIPAQILDNTFVFFLGDNGTDRWVDPPAPREPDRVKMTVYEGGVNVPLIVTGPDVPGGRVERPLAHVVDLFATVLELAGADMARALPESLAVDSVSMAPYLFEPDLPSRRSWVLAEGRMDLGGGNAARDERYKLIVMDDREEFYDIQADPNELEPLPLQTLSAEARSAYDRLRNVIDDATPE